MVATCDLARFRPPKKRCYSTGSELAATRPRRVYHRRWFGSFLAPPSTSSALISQLRDEVAYLRDENRRKDEIIMHQAMTMRQLTAAPPQEPTEAAETVEEEPERAEPLSDRVEAQEAVQRPWWRRVFGS
jgi:hypothetical protein